MTGRNVTVIIIVLAVLAGGWYVLNARQSGPPSPAPEVTTQPTETTAPATNSAATQEMVIHITSAGFDPQKVTIKAGDSVTWVNDDTANHQVNSAPHPTHEAYPPLNTIGLLKPGEKKSLTFPTAGTYKFHDHLNPTHFGSVTVE